MPTRRSDFVEMFLHPLESSSTIWTGDLTYWQHAHTEIGDLEERFRGPDGLLVLQEELGMFPYFQYDTFWPWELAYPGIEVEYESGPHRRRTVWTTKSGCLSAESRYLADSYCWAVTRHPVQNAQDLDVLAEVLAAEQRSSRLSEYKALEKRWGERGYLSIGAPKTPLSSLMVEWAGALNLAYLVADAPEKVRRILSMMDGNNDSGFQIIMAAGVPVVHFADNLSSDHYTGYFDEYLEEYYRRRIEQLHSRGIRCAVHLDGTVRGLLPRLSRVGFDAVESITPAPVGDVELAEARSLAGREDLILWGGLPGAIFSALFPEGRFRQFVAHLLHEWRGGPFIVGTADQVPPDADIERCGIVSEMIAQSGG